MILAGVLLGAAAILWATLCLSLPGRRLEGIVLGSAGLAAGSVAVLAYLLPRQLDGMDIDAIPHEPVAEWFVCAFGAAALLAKLLLVVRRTPPSLPGERARSGAESEDADRPLATVVPLRRRPQRPRSEPEKRPPEEPGSSAGDR